MSTSIFFIIRPIQVKVQCFRIRFQFHQDIWIFIRKLGFLFWSVSYVLKFLNHRHRGARLCGVDDTAEPTRIFVFFPSFLRSYFTKFVALLLLWLKLIWTLDSLCTYIKVILNDFLWDRQSMKSIWGNIAILELQKSSLKKSFT